MSILSRENKPHVRPLAGSFSSALSNNQRTLSNGLDLCS